MTSSRRGTFLISIIGALAVAAYAVWGAVHVLVVNPLAAVPGSSLDEIYAAIAEAGQMFSMAWVLGILGIGVVLAVAAAWVCIATKAPPIVAAAGPLALLVLGAPAYFMASFGPGMALADTFMISGRSYSAGHLPLYAISALAAVAVIVLAVSTAIGSRYEPAPA
ncbi:hypothetical protein [Microbacterium abyssi]|uniref:hypothetical protein n=1 Tax=Microbacterium abyssi TaxID=2782166 RepID=UPI0018873FA5|nr:hypothetical protein [Microbacterium sp. A18JL241]